MSAIDDLLNDYEAVAAAAYRLEQTRGQHEGEHELCCTSGRCVKCEEIRNEAEAHLKQTLLKVAPHPFRMAGDHSARPLAETEAQTTLPVASAPAARIGAAEYLRRFFSNWRS